MPIYTDLFAPPLPSPHRFYNLEPAVRAAIDVYSSDARVAAIRTGHLSQVWRASQAMEAESNPEFDRRTIAWPRNGDIEAILDDVDHESMARSGTGTHGVPNVILMLGVAGP